MACIKHSCNARAVTYIERMGLEMHSEIRDFGHFM